jgi:hypothetical protein
MKRNDSAKECQIMNKKNILVKMVPNFMKTIFQEMHRSTGMITQCDTWGPAVIIIQDIGLLP